LQSVYDTHTKLRLVLGLIVRGTLKLLKIALASGPRATQLAICLLGAFLFYSPAHGQDPQQSQFYAVPLVQNPAFAGLAQRPRAFVLYRTQWTGTGQPLKSMYASGDIYLKKASSGLGVVFGRTTALGGVYEGVEARMLYSYHQKLSKRFSLAYGGQLGIEQRSLGYSRLIFGDQIDSTGRFRPSADPSAQDRTFVVPEVGAGFILYDKAHYLSVSARHINSPKLGQDAANTRLPIWLAVTGGKVFRMSPEQRLHDYYPQELTLAFLYKQQGQYRQLDLGAYYTYQPIVVGIWYRGLPGLSSADGVFNHDAVSFLLGIKQDNLSIGYSYDLNLSGLVPMYAGSHELTLGYVFEQAAQQIRVRRALPCPSF